MAIRAPDGANKIKKIYIWSTISREFDKVGKHLYEVRLLCNLTALKNVFMSCDFLRICQNLPKSHQVVFFPSLDYGFAQCSTQALVLQISCPESLKKKLFLQILYSEISKRTTQFFVPHLKMRK